MVRYGAPRRVEMYSSMFWSAGATIFSGAMGVAMGPGLLFAVLDPRRPPTVAGPIGLVALAGTLAIGFLLLAGAVYSGRLLFGRPALVIDGKGIAQPAALARPRFLPWSHIDSVVVRRYAKGDQIAVAVRDDAPLRTRRIIRTGRKPEMRIPALLLPVPVDRVVDEIAALAPADVEVGRGWFGGRS